MNINFQITRLIRPLRYAALAGLAAALAVGALAQQKPRAGFDHLLTGFPLTGVHAITPCESCHVGGQFAATPRNCDYCHRAGSRVAVTVMPMRHVPTTEACDNCHRSAMSWAGARFPHFTVTPGTCMLCHNNSTAAGKPAGHIVTTQSCDACHRTVAWSPAGYNHAGVTPGTCMTCHGITATGKPANHVATTLACDACHTTTAWLPAAFNHSGVLPGTCMTCHGVTATGKPATHMPTNASCDGCHTTTAWRPSYFNHSNVTPGTCLTCHNGTTATGRPNGHMVTTRSCDACHTTAGWLPTTAYSHLSPNWKPHAASVTCFMCHTTKTESATWPYAAYQPDCAGCHANKYVPDPHKKAETPTTTIFYSVAELKNCSGACHQYSDGTFTTIKLNRPGPQHRSTSSMFP